MPDKRVEIKVRLTQKEAVRLQRLVKRSGLSREAYLRHLIGGVVPKEIPPPDYFSFMDRLYQVGSLLRQISQQAYAQGAVEVSQYEKVVGQFHQLVEDITTAVILPRRM
jgi:hypothetical protein